MGAYRLYTVVPRLVRFIGDLTNVYVRYNRKRLKGGKSEQDCLLALTSLFDVLLTLCKVGLTASSSCACLFAFICMEMMLVSCSLGSVKGNRVRLLARRIIELPA